MHIVNSFQQFVRTLVRRSRRTDAARTQEELERRSVRQLQATAGRRIPSREQFRYLSKYLAARERTALVVLTLIVVVALTLLGWRFYWRHTVIVPAPGGEYVEGLVGTPQFINPILADVNDADRDIARLVYSGLVRIDDTGQVIPDLAERFEISEDQKSYTFTLRPDVMWHDSSVFDADDVAFTIRSIQDPEFRSPLAVGFVDVGVEVVDPETIRFTLPEPFTPFLSSLTVGILPEHLWSAIAPSSANLADLNLKPVGTGPYQFAQLVKESTGEIRVYTLTRSETYYGPKPYIERISFKFYPDPQAATEALRNRNIEGLSFVPKEEKESLAAANRRLAYYSLRLPQYTAIFFNQKQNTVLRDKAVRTAMTQSIDKQRIVNEALLDEGQVIHSPILPQFLGHNPEVKQYAYDPAAAERTLDEAGWKMPLQGEVNYRTKGDAALRLTLTTVDQPEQVRTAELLQEAWNRVGFDITIDAVNPRRIQQQVIKPRDYEILLFGEIVGVDPDPYPFWHSSQNADPGLNLAVFSNKNVDQLLEEARTTNDSEQRRLKYLHFQNIVAEELPAIFLYNPFYTYAVDSRIHGITASYITNPSDRFLDIRNWYIETESEWR